MSEFIVFNRAEFMELAKPRAMNYATSEIYFNHLLEKELSHLTKLKEICIACFLESEKISYNINGVCDSCGSQSFEIVGIIYAKENT